MRGVFIENTWTTRHLSKHISDLDDDIDEGNSHYNARNHINEYLVEH